MEKFQKRIIKKTKKVIKKRRKEIINGLANTGQNFIVVDDKQKKIKKDLLKNTILENEEIKTIESQLKDIMWKK